MQLPFITEGSDKRFGLALAPSLELAVRVVNVLGGRPLWLTASASVVALTTLTVPDPLGETPSAETPFNDHTVSVRVGAQFGL